MGNGSAIEMPDDPLEKATMMVNGLFYTLNSPMLLQKGIQNKFQIDGVTVSATVRLVDVSGKSLIEPEGWVNLGGAKWSITPAVEQSQSTFVLFSREFVKPWEISCEFFGADHPFYISTTFGVSGPFVWGYPTHKAVIPLPRTLQYSSLSILADSRIGESVRLIFTGDDGIPEITSANPQPMTRGGVTWNFNFKKLEGVTQFRASVECEDGSKPYLDYVPTDRVETGSSLSEHSETIESSTDSAKE